MGILDEAIREHLALKRRQGLSDDELKRLEDEAFGPPARPGEPDFPDQEVDEAAVRHHEALTDPGDEPALEEAPGQPSLEETRVQPVDVGEEAEAISEPAALEEEEPEPGESALAGPSTAKAEAQGADDSEEPAAEGAGTGLFDHTEEGELDIAELELALDEEGAGGREPEQLGGSAKEEAGGAEAPIESLETVEHPVEELEEAESDEFEFAEPESEEPESEELEFEESDSGQQQAESDGRGESAEDEEDVLEETPDFLRDAPEDDELWFEQGEPKDFDF